MYQWRAALRESSSSRDDDSDSFMVFFFNDTATTEIYTLSLHDALPIFLSSLGWEHDVVDAVVCGDDVKRGRPAPDLIRSEEHTSELQSRQYLVCRLLLEKKKKISVCSSYFLYHVISVRFHHLSSFYQFL